MGARVTPSRWVALNLLRATRGGELLDPAFARLAPQVAPRDRAWVQEVVYGTLRLRGRLDFLLSNFLRRPPSALEPDVLDVLRLGAYQLLEMGGVPAYAAVSQAVLMTRDVSGRAASGLVNGVLQSLRRGQEDGLPQPPTDLLGRLETWGSHPRWLVERWLRIFGAEQTADFVAANNERPATYLHLLNGSAADALPILCAEGCAADTVPGFPEAVRLSGGAVVRALELVTAIVQDPAAMLVSRYAGFSGEAVVDLCSAPGGKTLALRSRALNPAPGFIAASDVSFSRIGRVRENVARTGARELAVLVADARRPPFRSVPQVLLDVPCTGTGTLRRHPDAKWRVRETDLVSLVALQRDILNASAQIVAPGGLLVYATCSLEPEENEQQVESFLQQHTEFSLEPPARPEGGWLDRGFLRVLPAVNGFDGAFAARLRRAA